MSVAGVSGGVPAHRPRHPQLAGVWRSQARVWLSPTWLDSKIWLISWLVMPDVVKYWFFAAS